MSGTITLHLDEKTYDLIQTAASGARRSVANFIEFAAITYLAEDTFVSESEMREILEDKELAADLKQARIDIHGPRYAVGE